MYRIISTFKSEEYQTTFTFWFSLNSQGSAWVQNKQEATSFQNEDEALAILKFLVNKEFPSANAKIEQQEENQKLSLGITKAQQIIEINDDGDVIAKRVDYVSQILKPSTVKI